MMAPTPDQKSSNEDQLDVFMIHVNQEVTQGLVGNIINFGGAKSSTSYEVRVDIEEDEDDIEGTIEHIIKRNEALTIADRETESDDEVSQFKLARGKQSEEELLAMEARSVRYQAFVNNRVA